MKSLSNEIKAYALKNALEHGKAIPLKILPKLFRHGLKKEDIKKTLPEIDSISKKVNSLSKTELESELEKYKKYLGKKRERKEGLPELENTKKLVMRFEPSPSGPLHIGHAYVLALNNEYVKKYNGKLILRIGDTNPENIYEPAYKLIEEDAQWLTSNNISKVVVQSDRLALYYKYFEKLLDLNKAYICTCNPEEFKKLLAKNKACPCRELKNQKERWNFMFNKYEQGEAVARLKTDLGNKNPAMRDFPLFRINDTPHPKQGKKFRVWPLMNMAVSVDDLETKVTHVIRAKDHVDNAKRQEIIHSYLKKKTPKALFVGRINFTGMPLSSTLTKEEIEKGKYSGWDDIRLPFLLSLRRRGFTPESLITYATGVGITLTDKTVSKEEFFTSIETFNRRILDPSANRYSFVANPIEIKIENKPEIKEVKVPIHPDKKSTRKVKVGKIFISEVDFEKFKGKEIRLLHLYNITLDKNKHAAKFTSKENKNIQKINWVSSYIDAKVLMPNGIETEGFAEEAINTLKNSEIVQYERYGFVKLDHKEGNKLIFWFTHK